MGADIHWVLEFRPDDTKKWIGLYSTNLTPIPPQHKPNKTEYTPNHYPLLAHRNYEFFGALAGVRGYGPSPNGLPSDLSDLASMEVTSWGTDGHSYGHMPVEEFCRIADRIYTNNHFSQQTVIERLKGNTEKDYTLSLMGLYPRLRAYRGDFRVVFWFDN